MEASQVVGSNENWELVRLDTAAGVALIRQREYDKLVTRWMPWHGSNLTPSLDLTACDFDLPYALVRGCDDKPEQNVLVMLHGRGDTPAPFAKLATKMGLPQTGAIALQAPLKLPLGLGSTWMHDLDRNFRVIPPMAKSAGRSSELERAGDKVVSFLHTLHDKYHWPYERIFLFGFSQGACVAYHVAMTLSKRLGGCICIAGGLVEGPHTHLDAYKTKAHVQTPGLLIHGQQDNKYPLGLAIRSYHLYRKRYGSSLCRILAFDKSHGMIESEEEMLQVMTFLSKRLYLRNFELEQRSDLIQVTNM